MPRVQIARFNGSRQLVEAEVNYITYINGKQIVKLNHVNINGILVNHCWLYYKNLKKPFEFYRSSLGRKITFSAKIDTYYKIKNGKRVMDYCLMDVTNIKFI